MHSSRPAVWIRNMSTRRCVWISCKLELCLLDFAIWTSLAYKRTKSALSTHSARSSATVLASRAGISLHAVHVPMHNHVP